MDVLDWLLDSDPAIRWQVMRDLTGTPADAVQAERNLVATHGWGARLLQLQGADGQWDGGTYWPAHDDDPDSQPWTATTYSLLLLRDFGLDPASREARHAITLVRDNSRWEEGNQLFFEGETEPCINGMTVALGAYFGENVDSVVKRLSREQLADGGWNCEAERGSTRSSFHTTICVLEGLLEHERSTGGTSQSRQARERGEEYLLERALLRRKSSGEVISPDWLQVLLPHPLVLRRSPRPGLLPRHRLQSGRTPAGSSGRGAVQTTAQRHMAAGEHPPRPGPLRPGRRRRATKPVEHSPCPARHQVVRRFVTFDSPCLAFQQPPPVLQLLDPCPGDHVRKWRAAVVVPARTLGNGERRTGFQVGDQRT